MKTIKVGLSNLDYFVMYGYWLWSFIKMYNQVWEVFVQRFLLFAFSPSILPTKTSNLSNSANFQISFTLSYLYYTFSYAMDHHYESH